MCGISGKINFDGQPVSKPLIRSMMHAMNHRGPDDTGTYFSNNIGLGFVRLSIIDLSFQGHQPMHDPERRYTIIYNGEVFNYIELKKELISRGYSFYSNTDTEIVLNSYKEWGEKCLDLLNGMWSFCIYDKKKKTLFLSRDRYGIKPLYYFVSDKSFIFASDIKSILKAEKNKLSPNKEAIYNYLFYNRTDYDNETFFSEIKKVNPGHNLKILLDGNQNEQELINKGYSKISKNVFSRKWYDLKSRVSESKTFLNHDEYRNLLFSSIDLRLRSDVPVGISLSGGLDSSSILTRLIDKRLNLNTFSAVYGENIKGDEMNYIKEFKNIVQKMNFVKIKDNDLYKDLDLFLDCHSSEPIVDTSIYASFKVFEEAHKKIKVTLNGQGADEQLGGYIYFWGHYLKNQLKKGKFINVINELVHSYKNQNNLSSLYFLIYFLSPQSFKFVYRSGDVSYLKKDFVNSVSDKRKILNLVEKSSSLQDSFIRHFNYKLQHLLKWEDINSMNFSIESRLPFLDYRLVEKTLSLEGEEILFKGQTKYILRKALNGYLPEKIRTRRDKVGFETPADTWFRNENFKKRILSTLDSSHFAQLDIIDTKKAIKLYKMHLSKKMNISRDIWKWINLDFWFKKHFS